MRVFSRTRRTPTLDTAKSFDSTITMSAASVSTNNSRPNSRDDDELQEDVTGFPPYFRKHTTSRRHPDAITTPGACITAEDVDPSKALSRTRHQFLKRHKRTVSHGKIEPESPSQHQGQSTAASAAEQVDAARESGDDLRDHGEFPESPEQQPERTKSGRRLSNPFKRLRSPI